MRRRELGSDGLSVSALGLGCVGMSELYGARDEAEALRTIDRALELGIDLLDTADMYGPFTNEELVGRAIASRRCAGSAWTTSTSTTTTGWTRGRRSRRPWARWASSSRRARYDDYRRFSPRFRGENFERNLGLADVVGEIAAELELDAPTLERIAAALPEPAGDRYDEVGMRLVGG
ncbi:MAG: aldo/keto reductase [Solirubrobacteraceae bacterium]